MIEYLNIFDRASRGLFLRSWLVLALLRLFLWSRLLSKAESRTECL